MKNLQLTSTHNFDISSETIAIDGECRRFFYQDGNILHCKQWNGKVEINQYEHPCSLQHMAYVPDLEALVMIDEHGSVLKYVWSEDSEPEEVAFVDTNVIKLLFSPTGEYALIVGSKQFYLLQTCDFSLSSIETSTEMSEVDVIWRPDGTMWAWTYEKEDTGDRIMEVWSVSDQKMITHSEAGVLQGRGLSWRPSSAGAGLITAVKESNDDIKVLLLEPSTGKPHDEITLDIDYPHAVSIRQIAWNNDGEVLAILMNVDNEGGLLHLWRQANAKWYCLGVRRFTPSTISWDERYALRLWGDAQYWDFDYHVCAAASGSVAVIDGRNVYVTHMQQATIPPPLYAEKHSFDGMVSMTAYSPTGELAVLLASGTVVVGSEQIESDLVVEDVTGFIWCDELYAMQGNDIVEIKAQRRRQVDVPSSLYLAHDNTCGVIEGAWAWVCGVADGVVKLDGLTSTLYLNDTVLLKNCVSAAVHGDVIIATSHVGELWLYPSKTSRPVERGSRVIAACGTKVVLQVPRGNLETVHPRAMVMTQVEHLLDNEQYWNAFELMRTHRINVSLIINHFDEPIVVLPAIVKALSIRPDYLTLLASSLDDPSMCKVMRHAMEHDHIGLQLPILTTYVGEGCIEEALVQLWTNSKQGNDTAVLNDGLSYLLLLVSSDDAYMYALASGYWDLAAAVVANTDRDPQVEGPFMDSVRVMDGRAKQRCAVFKRFGMYNEALDEMISCDVDAAAEMVRERHELWQRAHDWAIEHGDEGFIHTLDSIHAHILADSGQWEQSAYIAAGCDEWELALEGFSLALLWREALVAARHTNTDVALPLVKGLSDVGRHVEAASILRDECGDRQASLSMLIDTGHWAEALRWCKTAEDTDAVKRALLSTAAAKEQTIHSNQADLVKLRKKLAGIEAAVQRYGGASSRVDKVRLAIQELEPKDVPELNDIVRFLRFFGMNSRARSFQRMLDDYNLS